MYRYYTIKKIIFTERGAMASVNCCDATGSCDASVAGDAVCQEVEVDFVDELPSHVDKTFKKTHKRDESRISKVRIR